MSYLQDRRSRIYLSKRGLISESYSPASLSSDVTFGVSGQVLATLIPLLAGDTITSLSCLVQNAGSGVSLVKLALYDTSGNLLRATADWHTTIVTTNGGLNTINLTSSYPIVRDDVYYIAALVIYSTTSVKFRMPAEIPFVGAGIGAAGWSIGNYDAGGNLDLPNPITWANPAGGINPGGGFWVGAS